jgi:hypothetical protein
MKKSIIAVNALLLVLLSCAGRDRPAFVFAVNAYARPVSLRIGEEPGPVWTLDNLPANRMSAAAPVRTTGRYPVFYRAAEGSTWQRLPRELGEASCLIRPGAVTALVVDPRGFIRAQAFGDDDRPGARISFLNATTGTLRAVTLFAEREEAFPVFRAHNVVSGTATRFRSIVPGDYRLQALFSPGPAAAEWAVSCSEPAYWVICCFIRNNSPVFELQTFDRGEENP